MGLGGIPNINKLMKQAEEMQRKMDRMQVELGEERVEATAGGGMVSAVATGLGELLEVRIKPEVVDPDDVEMLQDLVVAAVNEALSQANARREARMSEIAGGMGLPGMGKLPGF